MSIPYQSIFRGMNIARPGTAVMQSYRRSRRPCTREKSRRGHNMEKDGPMSSYCTESSRNH